jgi:hypothetical protein
VRRPALALLGLTGGLGGCGSETPAPAKPTWVDDVLPLMQANCFHCHGPVADSHQWGTLRWDVYDLTDPKYATVGGGEVFELIKDGLGREVPSPIFVSARNAKHFDLIPTWVSVEATDDARMPPAPAERLSRRDIAVLQNWAATGFTRGDRPNNGKPAIEWLEQGKTFGVTDADRDQVLGKLDCGGTEVKFDRSGNHTLPAGAHVPCSGMLYDGFDLVPVELK